MSAPMSDEFAPFDRAWLNTAHQGPMPLTAAAAGREAIEAKLDPRRMSDEAFFQVPAALRSSLGELVGAGGDEIVLGNSTSYGLNLLAHGLPLRDGDEVLLVDGDFPATIYPWLPLQRRGVRLRTVPAPSGALEPEDLDSALTDRTRVVCTSWVFSFTGHAAEVADLVDVCRQRENITFVLNGSQAVGARPADVYDLGVDALVSCGFKWLCGPYATGFAWLRPALMRRMEYEQGYWLAQVGEIANPPGHYALRQDLGAAAYDVFCTANLSVFPSWHRAVSLLLERGIHEVQRHDQALIDQLITGLPEGWVLRSPAAGARRSTLVLLEPEPPDTVARALRRLDVAGVDAAERAGKLRLSPHVHNTPADIERALAALAA
ncbi:aminotransferase class V-fold PLP-dependent enzyme [Saccharopolyspora sp. NPDC049357]|uniref:aminotransferase class V-fold PLP-dependent enzyme n=1 Tax=Saccharopolyspora sp. NPDC049357 TaxID=3154507 RepID=UPI00341D3DE3